MRFIAAHTLAVKISRDWDSLPKDQYLSLKDRLLHWLQQSSLRTISSSSRTQKTPVSGEKIVLRKLAVAVSWNHSHTSPFSSNGLTMALITI